MIDITDEDLLDLASVGVTLASLPIIRKILARHNASFEAAGKRAKDADRAMAYRQRQKEARPPPSQERHAAVTPAKIDPPRPSKMLEVIQGDSEKGKVEVLNTRERRDRGCRLPDDWQPNVGHWDRAVALGYDRQGFARVTEEFRNYWWSTAGARGRKTSWDMTFTNRLIDQSSKYGKGKPNGNGTLADNLQGASRLLDQQEERGRERGGDDLFELPRLQQNA